MRYATPYRGMIKAQNTHSGNMLLIVVNPDWTANTDEMNNPARTGATVNSRIPFLSIGLHLPQTSRNVEPSIREAAILDTYR